MTRRQRAQVVELLRCWVDDGRYLIDANIALDGTIETRALAFKAFDAVPGRCGPARRALEAALRVEQGEWP